MDFQRLLPLAFIALLPPPAAEAQRPNVLFIISDDLRDELGCYGAKHIRSPNIDKLASRGTTFRRAYCQYALCGPSRASLFTGRYPDRIGVLNNKTLFRTIHPDIVSLPQHFKNQGYRTQAIGKLLHNGQFDPQSWSDLHHDEVGFVYASKAYRGRRAGIDGIHASNKSLPLFEGPDVDDDAYRDGRATEIAIEALADFARDDQQFFLMVGYHKPHTPFNAPKKYWDLYDRDSIRLAPNQFPPKGTADFIAQGAKYMQSFQGIPEEGRIPDDLQREIKHAYYACISYIDAQVGRLLDAVARNGLTENTIIVFTSDHGYQLGEHDLWCKHTNFETSTKVPLIIADPRQKRRGTHVSMPCELIDLTPTLTQLCGIPALKTADGASLARLLNDPSDSADMPGVALSRYNKGMSRGFSIRTRQFRYTEWRHAKTGELVARELYDHRHDHGENRNQVTDPKYADAVKELQQCLAQQRQLSHARK
jgi:arylsulfatase A-like enzyme